MNDLEDDDDIKVTHCKAINNPLHCNICFEEAVQDFNALEDGRRKCFMEWVGGPFDHLTRPNCERSNHHE